MKQEVNTIEEAEAIVNPLMAENKWAITVVQTVEGKYIITWLEHKMYIATDGKEYRDEVWTTKEGEMKLVQELEPEHARNIIRMMLRQERKYSQIMESAMAEIQNTIDSSNDMDDSEDSSPKVFH